MNRTIVGDYVTDLTFRSVILVMRLFPYRSRVRAFGFLVAHIIAPLAGLRRRAEQNLKMIFPDVPEAERKRIASTVCDNLGRNIIEGYSKKQFADRLKGSDLHGPGMAAITAALGKKQPILLISGHYGNYEAVRVAFANLGHQVAGLYRPAENTFFNRHYVASLEACSGPAFPQSSRGMLAFLRHMRAGGIGAMLFDVRATRFGPIDFLGHPAPTSTAPAAMALKIGALVVPCFATRADDGLSFDIEVEEPVVLSTPEKMMRELTARLERRVRAKPGQWFWIHNRWAKAPSARRTPVKKEQVQ